MSAGGLSAGRRGKRFDAHHTGDCVFHAVSPIQSISVGIPQALAYSPSSSEDLATTGGVTTFHLANPAFFQAISAKHGSESTSSSYPRKSVRESPLSVASVDAFEQETPSHAATPRGFGAPHSPHHVAGVLNCNAQPILQVVPRECPGQGLRQGPLNAAPVRTRLPALDLAMHPSSVASLTAHTVGMLATPLPDMNLIAPNLSPPPAIAPSPQQPALLPVTAAAAAGSATVAPAGVDVPPAKRRDGDPDTEARVRPPAQSQSACSSLGVLVGAGGTRTAPDGALAATQLRNAHEATLSEVGQDGVQDGSADTVAAAVCAEVTRLVADGGRDNGGVGDSDVALFARSSGLPGREGDLAALGRELLTRLNRVQEAKASLSIMEALLQRELCITRSSLLGLLLPLSLNRAQQQQQRQAPVLGEALEAGGFRQPAAPQPSNNKAAAQHELRPQQPGAGDGLGNRRADPSCPRSRAQAHPPSTPPPPRWPAQPQKQPVTQAPQPPHTQPSVTPPILKHQQQPLPAAQRQQSAPLAQDTLRSPQPMARVQAPQQLSQPYRGGMPGLASDSVSPLHSQAALELPSALHAASKPRPGRAVATTAEAESDVLPASAVAAAAAAAAAGVGVMPKDSATVVEPMAPIEVRATNTVTGQLELAKLLRVLAELIPSGERGGACVHVKSLSACDTSLGDGKGGTRGPQCEGAGQAGVLQLQGSLPRLQPPPPPAPLVQLKQRDHQQSCITLSTRMGLEVERSLQRQPLLPGQQPQRPPLTRVKLRGKIQDQAAERRRERISDCDARVDAPEPKRQKAAEESNLAGLVLLVTSPQQPQQ